MEFNKKARGQKHHRNKARYQNKAKIVTKPTSETSNSNKIKDTDDVQRGLPSNWDHYRKLTSDSDDDTVDDSTNFSLLAQAPISHGGHFQFKSDKNIESEFDYESLRNNKMFSLDLHMLESSLNTIPFHERCILDKSYLTDSQLEDIYKRSQQNKIQYESYLKLNSVVKEFSNHTITSGKSNEPSKPLRKVEDDVDSLFNTELLDKSENSKRSKDSSKAQGMDSPKIENHNNEEKQNLEEWLDDILND